MITSKIQTHIRKYIEIKQEYLENFFNIVEEIGLKIVDNCVKILNKYGLFTINLINGTVLFEPIFCENCKNFSRCKKNSNESSKKLCIVSDSVGWSNVPIGGDKLLILSKIFAILNEKLPNHVLNQMKQVLKCLNIPSPKENERLMHHLKFNAHDEDILIYENLATQEKKNRLKQLRAFLWDGRIPPSTYYKMIRCINQEQ